MYDEILSNYTDSEIVQICKFLNKDYNIYERKRSISGTFSVL